MAVEKTAAASARFGIAPTKFGKGLVSLKQPAAEFMETIALADLLEREWESDAHFTTYTLETDDGAWPRLTKPVLPELIEAGAKLTTQYVVIDYDNPSHLGWSRELWDEFETKLVNAATAGHSLALNWSAFYTTDHGARFIYILEHAVDVEIGEFISKQTYVDFNQMGLEADSSTSDWTRMFRAPRVIRDGKATKDHPFFQCEAQLENRIPVPIIDKSSTKLHTQAKVHTTGELRRPADSEAKSLLVNYSSSAGRPSLTQWYKTARRHLKDKECYAAIFDSQPIAEHGQRNSKIFSYAGIVVATTISIPGTTVQLCYALLLESVLKLDGDDSGTPWTDTLWRAVTSAWEKESVKWEVKKRELAVEDEERQNIVIAAITGMRTWNKAGELRRDDSTALEYISQHAIALLPDGHVHLLTPNGYYDPVPLLQSQIMARIRELRMEKIIPLERMSPEGMKERRVNEIMNEHGTIVTAVEGQADKVGATIMNIGQPNSKLIISLYTLNKDIKAEYNNEVATWLAAFAGTGNVRKLGDWIGHALNFTGPICALSINGPPGIGKKLLIRGLAENITGESYADVREMTSAYQSAIATTPFLICNEGFPRADKSGMRDPADSFRHFVSGDAITVNPKFRTPYTIYNPVRILVLGNNQQVIGSLYKHRNLSPEDRDALAIRLFHIDATNEAALYLRSIGGLAHTAAPHRRWIRGDSGEPSHHIVASHFRWLYEHRPPIEHGSRFLIEGDLNSGLVRLMSVGSQTAPEVIETVLRMIESPTSVPGLHWECPTLHITSSGIVEFGRKNERYSGLNAGTVSFVLRGLVARNWIEGKILALGKEDGPKKRARWYALDLDLLHEQAILHGYPCSRLEAFILERDRQNRNVALTS